MDKEITVSVIIPMYNVEHIINRCLHSLEQQNLKGVEFLFVDDCSTDNTINKLSAWITARQNTVKYYRLICHETNQGVAVARNTGLEHAQGKYVYYIDADDYIEPDTLSALYNIAEEQQADIVGCEWYLTFEKNERHMMQCDVKTGKELFQKMAQGVMRWNLWLFLVKRDLYESHGIRFIPQQNMGEDMMVMSKISLLASKVQICHKPYYHYVQYNANSLTKKYQYGFSQIVANLQEIEDYLQKNYQELKEFIYLMQLNAKLPFLISSRKSDYQFWLSIFSEANQYIGKNPNSSWYTRFIQLAARNKQFWILKLYYWVVIKVFYGCIYK